MTAHDLLPQLLLAKGLLPYRSLGSGIKRALEAWPDIAFTDDREGCLFTATVRRKEGLGHVEAVTAIDNKAYEGVGGGVNGGVNALLVHVHDHPGQRSSQIASALGLSPRTIERWIKQLRDAGQIEFRGAPKTGGLLPMRMSVVTQPAHAPMRLAVFYYHRTQPQPTPSWLHRKGMHEHATLLRTQKRHSPGQYLMALARSGRIPWNAGMLYAPKRHYGRKACVLNFRSLCRNEPT